MQEEAVALHFFVNSSRRIDATDRAGMAGASDIAADSISGTRAGTSQMFHGTRVAINFSPRLPHIEEDSARFAVKNKKLFTE